jgi:hypothetical protein
MFPYKMDAKYHFDITPPKSVDDRATLYLSTLYDYKNDGNEGCIEFDGYFYYTLKGDEPEDEYSGYTRYKPLEKAILSVFYDPNGVGDLPERPASERLTDTFWEIEFIRREIVKNTNSYSEIEDDDGEIMNVCFFSTNHQRIYFKILREIKKGESLPEEYK